MEVEIGLVTEVPPRSHPTSHTRPCLQLHHVLCGYVTWLVISPMPRSAHKKNVQCSRKTRLYLHKVITRKRGYHPCCCRRAGHGAVEIMT